MRISVVVPTFNRCESLKRLLDSLTKQNFADFEVVIVDNNSSDGTPQLVKEYEKKLSIQYVQQKGEGFIDAVNTGLEKSRGEIFLRTDDDAQVSPEWLAAINRTFGSATDIGGVTGPVNIAQGYLQNRDLFFFQEKLKHGNALWKLIGKFYYDYLMEGKAYAISKDLRCGTFTFGANFISPGSVSSAIEVDHLEPCNMALRADALKKVGGFDEQFVGTADYSDTDVVYKIKKLGFKMIFEPSAVVWHYQSKQGFFSERFHAYNRVENFMRFYFRHFGPDSLDKALRFAAYLFFLNGYFFYLAFSTGNVYALGSFPATLFNFFKFVVKKALREEI